jgi:hypothetical protein
MLGLRFNRLVHVTLASGSVALTGCPGGGEDTDSDTDTDTETEGTDSDEPTTTVTPTTDPPPPPPPADVTPPLLVGVEFLDPQILRLTFTEPIAPVDQVNPKRFRLSVGRFYTNDYYGNYQRTVYNDPENYNHEQYCNEVCYDYYNCYYQCYYGPTLSLDALDVLPDAYNPAQVVLLLEQSVTNNLCNFINAISGDPSRPAGLLLHYADGGASQITDLAGIPLLGFGETWVKESDQTFLYVDDLQFPELNPFLPIPCPF